MDSPVFKVKIIKGAITNITVWASLLIGVYLLWFFINLGQASGSSGKAVVLHQHSFFLILAVLAILVIIYFNIRNTYWLFIYNRNGIISIKIIDKLNREIMAFQSPFQKDFFYNRVKVSRGFTMNQIFLSFYANEIHLLTLAGYLSDMTPPPLIFMAANLEEKKNHIKKMGGQIYDTDKLVELIKHI